MTTPQHPHTTPPPPIPLPQHPPLPLLQVRLGSASTLANNLANQLQTLALQCSHAKHRTSLHPKISKVFEALQLKTHSKNIAGYEHLLSELVHDVLPDEGSIRLIPEYKNNETQLDIYLFKNNSLETIKSNGGALHNILSTGLRFIAIARSQTRQLIVLDEPDCWIKPSRVPKFLKTLSDISTHAHFQTLFISHHDPSHLGLHLSDISDTILIQRHPYDPNLPNPSIPLPTFDATNQLVHPSPWSHNSDTNSTYLVSITPPANPTPWPSNAYPGIRAIELINFREHQNSYIPLSPFTNAIIGDNNVGKSSALFHAIDTLSGATLDDSYIRRHQHDTYIRLYLENNQVLQLHRKKDRSPPLIYTLYSIPQDPSNPDPTSQNNPLTLHELPKTQLKSDKPPSRNTPPTWVSDLLKLSPVDDLQLHLQPQTNPIFLLHSPPAQRARLLAIGSETEHLFNLIQEYDSLRQSDKTTIKSTEQQIAAILQTLQPIQKPLNLTLNTITTTPSTTSTATHAHDSPSPTATTNPSPLETALQALQTSYQTIQTTHTQLSTLHTILQTLNNPPPALPSPNHLPPTLQAIQATLATQQTQHQAIATLQNNALPTPIAHLNTPLANLHTALQHLNTQLQALTPPATIRTIGQQLSKPLPPAPPSTIPSLPPAITPLATTLSNYARTLPSLSPLKNPPHPLPNLHPLLLTLQSHLNTLAQSPLPLQTSASQTLTTAHNALTLSSQTLDTSQTNLQTFLKLNPTCPTCHQPLPHLHQKT